MPLRRGALLTALSGWAQPLHTALCDRYDADGTLYVDLCSLSSSQMATMRHDAGTKNLLREFRFAFRRLSRARVFSFAVITALGIGLGVAVAVGTLVFGVLLRPLPYPQPEQLVQIGLLTPGIAGTGNEHSEGTYDYFRDIGRSFADIGAYYTNDRSTLTDRNEAQRVTTAMVTPSLLTTLGAVPVKGRLFSQFDGEDSELAPVIMSYDLWRSRYGGDPAIVGKSIEVNRRPRLVIGILQAGFDFPTPQVKLWSPVRADPQNASLTNRYLKVIARLRYGVTLSQAQEELTTGLSRLPAVTSAITTADLERAGARVEVISLKDTIVASIRGYLQVLSGTVIVFLFLALANVANLVLLRSERVRPETAIAAALGASLGRVRQRFMVEGLLLGLAATVVAFPIAATAVRAKFGFISSSIPRLHEIRFGFGSVATLLVSAPLLGAFVGAMALARSGASQPHDILRSSIGSLTSRTWQRLQQGLVAVQIALALTLVLSALLIARSFWNLRQADIGFRPTGLTTFEISLPFTAYGTYAKAASFHASVIDRLRRIPGVADAAAVLRLPLTDAGAPGTEGRLEAVGLGMDPQRAGANLATPNYFQVMGIPVERGRTFAAGDLRANPPAVVLSVALARTLFGQTDPIGRQVRRPGARRAAVFEVVGVVGDVPSGRIEEGPGALVYFPLLRDGDRVSGDSIRIPVSLLGVHYVIHDSVPLPQLAAPIRALVRELDPQVPVTNLTTLPAIVDAAIARVRLALLLVTSAAITALILGFLGVYTVVSYWVTCRRQEFGLRLALGATPARIERLVLRQGAILAMIGVSVGISTVVAGGRLLESILFQMSPIDLSSYGLAVGILIGVTVVAAMLPARSAARIDPAGVMRGE